MTPDTRQQRLTWRQTIAMLRADRRRTAGVFGTAVGWLQPSMICIVLYRVSHHFYRGGHRLLARFFAQLNSMLTGADISEMSRLGEGLVIVSPAGVSIFGDAGRNLTVMPLSGLGGQIGRPDSVGARPGQPVLGDDVVLEPYCGVLGPVRVGNRVRVCTGIALTRDVPDDTVVESATHEQRVLPRRDMQ